MICNYSYLKSIEFIYAEHAEALKSIELIELIDQHSSLLPEKSADQLTALIHHNAKFQLCFRM